MGIFCINNPYEIAYGNKKTTAKIVQKYVENPFLIQVPDSKGVKTEQRKFDIR